MDEMTSYLLYSLMSTTVSKYLLKRFTLAYQINVAYQIDVALGIITRIDKHSLSNKRSLENFSLIYKTLSATDHAAV